MDRAVIVIFGGFKTLLIPESLLQPHGSSIPSSLTMLYGYRCGFTVYQLSISQEAGETILHYSCPPHRIMLMVFQAESIRMTLLDVWYILC